LLRAERKKPGSQNGALIQKCIDDGKIVPSQITIALLEEAMKELGWSNGKFLVDGFPRNEENFSMWNKMLGEKVYTPFIVFLDCSEETMIERCLKRGETSQRTDDNIEVLKKRFATFKDETMSVVKHF
jgi:UMP-CMP kinase